MDGGVGLELWQHGVIKFVQRGSYVAVQCSACSADLEQRLGNRWEVWNCSRAGCLMSYVPGSWDGNMNLSSVVLLPSVSTNADFVQDWMKKWFECWTGEEVEVSIEW